jgi:hypothetical protein
MEKELSKPISHLKSNKSPGLDNISNNMIKHSQTVLLKSLQFVFFISAFHQEFIQIIRQMDT